MPAWMEWGLEWISALQNAAPWGRSVMQSLSLAGTEYFYFLVMPAVLWCVDSGIGVRAGLLLVTSAGLNDALKVVFGLPRPYWISREVTALSGETSFGLPSGHAQNGIVLWGRLAAWARRSWFIFAAALIAFGVSVSRVFLGVHFPMDVLAGWAVGLGLLALALTLEEPLLRRLARLRTWAQIGLVLLASAVLVGMGVLPLKATEARPFPASWAGNAAAARPADDPLDPRSLDPFVARGGAFLGLGCGAVMLASWGRFRARSTLARSAARYAIGALGVLIVFLGLRAVLPAGEDWLSSLLRGIRYAALGFWIAYGAPRMFALLGT
ncbi:MAG: phosphatase PAP2 family protein [Anaerolineales bacterium]